MPGIMIREGDSFEAALKKFKKLCERVGILFEIRKREAFEKPSVRRKKKAELARKRGFKKGGSGLGSGPSMGRSRSF